MSLRRFFTILVLLGVTLTASLLLSLPALAAAGPAANVAPAENAPHRFAFQGCLPAVTVTSAGDDGAGSLRQAIVDVCDGGTIDFAAGLAGQTISLTSAELTIAKTVTIANPAAPGLAVSGNTARRVFMIQSSGVVTLSQLRIVNGAVSGEDYGGGIANYGRLTVLNSTLSGNAAPVGGGIYNRGSLSVVNSTLSGNWATEAGVGGGVCNNTDGQMTISNSALSGNSAYDGGGVYNNTNGTLTISNSSLVGNSASGDYSTGGGITNYGTLTVLNSTLSGNSASYMGGGVATMEGTSSVRNSTLSGNSAGYGGGIFSLGTLALANTIIANSPAGGDCQNSRPITADHSLVEATGANACGLTDGVGGNIVGVDPLLGPLGAYGGETQTYALLPGSRALDAGQNCLAADQRGVSRPQPAGGACDIGAFESRGFSLTYGGGSGQSALVTTPFAAPLAVAVSSAAGEPVDGGAVTFAGPPSGAGVTPVAATVTIAGGAASLNVTANGTAGSYTVSAAAAGAPARVDFALTNTCDARVTVTSAGDGGVGSLRQAIVDVCDGGTIDFAAGLAGQTIGLTSAELTIAKTVTIANPQAPGLAISGNAARRVFMIQSSGVVTLSQLSIVSGTVTDGDAGGGIYNAGRLTVLNSTLSGNAAPVGGGIYNKGSLSVVSSILSGNWATEAGVGGGVCNNTNGQMTISNSTLSGNSAYDGGGVYNNTSSTLTISNSTLSGNSTAGDYSTGGGITNYGTLTVLNSTLSGNSASYMGGGIANMEGTLSVQNSALSGNSAGYGGGIFSLGTLALANTIIANSPAGGDCQNSRPITADHSLVEATGANACGLADGLAGNIVGVDPLLGPLGAYGGETRTYALLPGSRALDAGQNCLAADQRGVSRPQPAGGACDIGAFESRGFSPDIAVLGNGLVVVDGDATPATSDGTGFGSAPVAGGQVTHTFTIHNDGDGDLNLTGTPPVSFAGPAAGDFALVGPPATPVTAGSTTTFQVRFDPGGAGSRVATVTIASDDPDEAIYDFAIQGEGLAPTVSLSVSATSGSEADQTQITVTATASANVSGAQTVALGVSGTGITAGDYSLSSATITIPDGQSSGSVTFTVRDDALDEDTETASLTINAPSAGIVLGSPTSQTVAIVDDDTRGVTLAESDGSTGVSEDGATDSYSLALTSQPTADVTITVNSGTQAEVRTGAGAYASSLDLTFTPAAWATPQTVQVRAVDDAVVEGDHSQAITHSAGGGDYVGLSIAAITAAITDNDSRYTLAAPADVTEGDAGVQPIAFTVTRSGDIARSSTVDVSLSGTATPGLDYSLAGVGGSGVSFISPTVTFGAGATQAMVSLDILGDYLVEGDEAITVTLSNPTGTGDGTGQMSSSPAAVHILDDDAAGITVSPTSLIVGEPDTTADFTISLDSQPTTEVTIALVSADPTECSVPAQVVLNAANWQSGVGVSVTAVDDVVSDGPQVCGVQTGAASSGDPNYDGRAVPDVTVAVADDDVPGVILSQTNAGVGEGGPNDTYTVRLASVPTDTVTVSFTPGSQLQAIAALTFAADASAMTPQTVTVRAVDDAVVEGDHGDTIGASASGGGYAGALFTPGNSVAVAIADNDLDFAISANQASVAEGSGSNTPVSFTVTRSGGITTTAASVDFALSGSVDSGDYQAVLPAADLVSFAAGERQKDITLDVVGDFVAEPDETLIVTLSGPSGPGSSTLTTSAAQTVIANDDAAGVIIIPTGGLTTTESGGTATFAVRLTSQPTAGVTITLVSADAGEGLVSPAEMGFSPANWNSAQTATVTGQDDLAADGDVAYTVQTSLTSGDADYSRLDPADVSLTNLDDDVPGYTFSLNAFKLGEGASRVVSLTLNTQPQVDVTINLSSGDPAECTVSPASVTLNAGNWQDGVSFTVGGVKDGVKDGDQPCTIVTAVSTADSVYGSLDPADVTLTVADTYYSYLPLIINRSAALPDLVVDSVTTGPAGPRVTIRNAGSVATPDAFWVDVYFNPSQTPGLNRPWQSIASYGANWGVTQSLAPGESLTLTIGGPYYADGSSSFPTGAQVYATVDSINYATTYGNVQESNEANNVFGPVVSAAGSGAVTPQVKPASLAELPER